MIEFYLAALAIGIFVSIEDFKTGLIKNKYVLVLLAIGFVSKFIYPVSMVQLGTTLVYGLTVSFFFWFFGIWPAGDAKFFWVLLFFLPPPLFGDTGIVWLFLINSFVPVFIVALCFIAYKSKLKIIKKAISEAIDPYRLFILFVMIAGFLWFFQAGLSLIGLNPDFLILLISLFLVFELFHRYCTFRNELIFTMLAVVRVLIDFNSVYTFSFFMGVFRLIVAFVFFRFFILRLSFYLYTKKIPIFQLKEGNEPAEAIYKQGKKFGKESLLATSFVSFMFHKKKKYVHSTESLSKKDIENLKKLKKDGKFPFTSILVYQTQPFAIFLVIGFVLTVLSNGSFFSLLQV